MRDGARVLVLVLVALGAWLGGRAVAAALAVLGGVSVWLVIRPRPQDHDDRR